MKLVYYLVLILSIIGFAKAINGKCRALVLSGGGDMGSYEAAVFITLTNLLPKEDIAYDVLTGVSAGSLNAMGLSAFAPLESEEAAAFLYSLWASVSGKDVYDFWPGGIFAGLFEHGGVLNSEPLINFCNEQIGSKTVKRKVSFGCTDTINADYRTIEYEPTDVMPDDLIIHAVASSSIPLVFPSVTIGDDVYVDGGGLWNVDIPSAVRRCKDIVDKDEDITIDIIFIGNHHLADMTKEELNSFTSLEHYMRSKTIHSFYDTLNKIERGIENFPNVNWRYVIGPSEKLSTSANPIPLDFSQKHVDRCFEVGRKDAENAVKLGNLGNFRVFQEFRDKILKGEKVNFSELLEQRKM